MNQISLQEASKALVLKEDICPRMKDKDKRNVKYQQHLFF